MSDNAKRLLEATLNLQIPENKSVTKTEPIMSFVDSPKSIFIDHFCYLFEKTLNSLIGASGNDTELEYFKWLDFKYLNEANKASLDLAKTFKDKGLTNLIVVGMGGSGIDALVLKNALFDNSKAIDKPYIEIQNNLDPGSYLRKLNTLKSLGLLSKTVFAFISKSGNTDEVNRNIFITLDYLTEAAGSRAKAFEQFAKQSVFITEANPKNLFNTLKKEIEDATGIKINSLDHHPEIGGRFSMFSPVGLFAAAMMGLDSNKLLIGAEACFKDLAKSKELEKSLIGKLALYDIILFRQGYRNKYSMVYSDSLEALNKFRAQLKGESLNKNGLDSTMHMAGIGTVNHHSDLELLFKEDNQVVLEQILFAEPINDHRNTCDGLEALKHYEGQSAHSSLVQGHILPIYSYLLDNGHPVLITVIDKQNEESLGYFMMQDMLVTVIQAGLQDRLDDAIRQKEVERYKKSVKDQISSFKK